MNRPHLPNPEQSSTSTTSTTTTTESTTSKDKTVLKKPSAIETAEKVEAVPQVFGQITSSGLQTSLIGVPNPFSTSPSGSVSYNKLAIAAALSVVPTLVIAFPFLAPSLGKKKRRK